MLKSLLFLSSLFLSLVDSQSTYYVNERYGSDSNNGLTTSTPWQSWNYAASQAQNVVAGSQILFCRGDRLFRQEFDSNTNPIGSLGSPIIFGSYDCRDTYINQVLYPLPLISSGTFLPQSPSTSWSTYTWTKPDGSTIPVLKYDLGNLNTVTGTTFINNKVDRANPGNTEISHLWVNGVAYREARFPDLPNNNYSIPNSVGNFLYMDPTCYGPSSEQTSCNLNMNAYGTNTIGLSPWTRPFLYSQLYGKNDATWSAGAGGSDYYYQTAFAQVRTDDYVIARTNMDNFLLGNIDYSDYQALLNQNSSPSPSCGGSSCIPNNYPDTDVRLFWNPVPQDFLGTNYSVTFYSPSLSVSNDGQIQNQNTINFVSNQPSSYIYKTNPLFFFGHKDFLSTPGEYFHDEVADILYLIPMNPYHELLLLNTPTTTEVPLTLIDQSLCQMDLNISCSATVLNWYTSHVSLWQSPQNDQSVANQNLEFKELQFAFSQGSDMYITASKYLSVHDCWIHDGGGGVVYDQATSSPTIGDPLYRYVFFFNNYINDMYGTSLNFINTPSYSYVANNTMIRHAYNWDSFSSFSYGIVAFADLSFFRNNIISYCSYSCAEVGGQIELNMVNYSSMIHYDVGALTANSGSGYSILFNIIDTVGDGKFGVAFPPNQIFLSNGQLVDAGNVAQSHGIYDLSIANNISQNIVFNSTENAFYGGNNMVPWSMSGNLMVGCGIQIGPWYTSLSDQQSYLGTDNVFDSNKMYVINPQFLPVAEERDNINAGSKLMFSQGDETFGRTLFANAPPTYKMWTNLTICLGFLEGSYTSDHSLMSLNSLGSVWNDPSFNYESLVYSATDTIIDYYSTSTQTASLDFGLSLCQQNLYNDIADNLQKRTLYTQQTQTSANSAMTYGISYSPSIYTQYNLLTITQPTELNPIMFPGYTYNFWSTGYFSGVWHDIYSECGVVVPPLPNTITCNLGDSCSLACYSVPILTYVEYGGNNVTSICNGKVVC